MLFVAVTSECLEIVDTSSSYFFVNGAHQNKGIHTVCTFNLRSGKGLAIHHSTSFVISGKHH